MKSRYTILSLLFVVCTLSISLGQSPEELVEQAELNFNAGKYDQSIQIYTDLVNQNYNSTDLYFNLATAYYKAGKLPYAVLYYEKVLKADPYNKAAKTNLRIVNDERASEFSSIPDFFITVWWRNFSSFLSPGLWSLLGLGSILFSVFMFYRWLMKNPTPRNLVSSILLLLLGILFLMAARTSDRLKNGTAHLINITATAIYDSPDADSKATTQLIPGEKMRILDRVGDWYQVMLINKEQGWVMKEGLEEI